MVGDDDHGMLGEKRLDPAAASNTRSSWRSAAAIESTCASTPCRCECASLSGSESSMKSNRSCPTRYSPTQPACLSRTPGSPSVCGSRSRGSRRCRRRRARAGPSPGVGRRSRGDPGEHRSLRGLLLGAAPGKSGRSCRRYAHRVIEALEDRQRIGGEMLAVHVVDRVGELAREPEAKRGAKARAVLDVAALRRGETSSSRGCDGDRGRLPSRSTPRRPASPREIRRPRRARSCRARSAPRARAPDRRRPPARSSPGLRRRSLRARACHGPPPPGRRRRAARSAKR